MRNAPHHVAGTQRKVEAPDGAQNAYRLAIRRADEAAAILDPNDRTIAAAELIATGKPRTRLRALRMGAAQLANAGAADA